MNTIQVIIENYGFFALLASYLVQTGAFMYKVNNLENKIKEIENTRCIRNENMIDNNKNLANEILNRLTAIETDLKWVKKNLENLSNK